MIGRRYVGLAYRAHEPAWSFLPISGEGASHRGGRFNKKGRAALYLSEQISTAILESQQGFAFKQPVTLCSYQIDCENIVDLTQPEELQRFGITVDDIACNWFELALNGESVNSWELAEKLIQRGAAGARFSSHCTGARPVDVNLVFWRWNETIPHMVRTIDDFSRLPKNQSSWR